MLQQNTSCLGSKEDSLESNPIKSMDNYLLNFTLIRVVAIENLGIDEFV